ncbi:phosphotransferase [Nocardia brasiliensis]|uniref:phosphotransferase n=1 Tax=Nocardia brasiliensis TaxID=37326 RepID=UPI003D8C31FA
MSFHQLPAPNFRLPEWDQIGGIRRRLEEQEVLSHGDAEFLTQRCDEIAAELKLIEPFLARGPIHGDGFVGNLIPGPAGPVICDFDSVAFGPPRMGLDTGCSRQDAVRLLDRPS